MSSLIEDLLNPSSLPDPTQKVDLIQTHISLVFVADRYVYKIKKPVDFGFLDFTSLEKRHYYCQKEIRLNSRLSEGLYLEVLPVTHDGKRHRLGPHEGEIVDYAVKMRRLPDDLIMKSLFQSGELRDAHLKKLADVLARFHLNATNTPEIDRFGESDQFKVNTDENFEQTIKYIGLTIEQGDYDALATWTTRFYVSNDVLFRDRIAAGKIRDCHGDLHMEHICFTDELAIFDCIEFNDRFRYSDTLSDIAFLLMDLEFHGGNAFSNRLWSLYKESAEEGDVESLLTFYKIYRAYVRGKVTSFQLDDAQIAPEEKSKAAETARSYFSLARMYIEGLN